MPALFSDAPEYPTALGGDDERGASRWRQKGAAGDPLRPFHRAVALFVQIVGGQQPGMRVRVLLDVARG